MNKTAEEINAILNNYVIKSPSIGRDVIIADRIDEIVDDLAAVPPPASEGGMAKEPNRPWVYYPGIQYQRLSNAISDTNGIALDSEMDEIVKIVHEDFPATLPTREPEGEFEMYENLFGQEVSMNDRFESKLIWSREYAIKNKGKWIPQPLPAPPTNQ